MGALSLDLVKVRGEKTEDFMWTFNWAKLFVWLYPEGLADLWERSWRISEQCLWKHY